MDPSRLLDSIYLNISTGTTFADPKTLQQEAAKQGYKIPLTFIREYLRRKPSYAKFQSTKRRYKHNPAVNVSSVHQVSFCGYFALHFH